MNKKHIKTSESKPTLNVNIKDKRGMLSMRTGTLLILESR